MANPQPLGVEPPDVAHLVTEDDTPVDNLASEKQQRLLTEPLYTSWPGPGEGRPFLAAANVGVFPSVHRPPIVPDVFLSLDVEVPDDFWAKRHRSYFAWEYGKVPELVIEIVSNREGGEDTTKLRDYARIGVTYYVIYDPQRLLQEEPLRVYTLLGGRYELRSDTWLPLCGLGLTLWEGVYEQKHMTWLRFCDAEGRPIPTGGEQAAEERRRADRAQQKAERLAARLRELGVDPDA